MKSRALAFGASLALALSLSSSLAHADDRLHRKDAAPTLPAPTRVNVDVGTLRLDAADRAELGVLWSRVVAAALVTLKSLAALPRIAREPVIPSAKAASPPHLSWQRDVSSGALRKEPAPPQRVRPTPVAADRSIAVEAREQHAVLLGAEMTLPWQVP